MFEEDKIETIRRYENRLKQFGYDVKSLGWRTKRQQYLRFEILAEIGDLNNSSVLDLGCGFGDFYDFLLEKGIKVDYTGYEISRKLIEIARERHPELKFEVKDILREPINRSFDYVVSSGIFNHKMSNNDLFIKEIFRKTFEICNIGIAHNMLSSYVDYMDSELYYASPIKIFDFCKTLSRRVTLRHDYMPFEFTVYVYKKDEKDSENIFKHYKSWFTKT